MNQETQHEAGNNTVHEGSPERHIDHNGRLPGGSSSIQNSALERMAEDGQEKKFAVRLKPNAGTTQSRWMRARHSTSPNARSSFSSSPRASGNLASLLPCRVDNNSLTDDDIIKFLCTCIADRGRHGGQYLSDCFLSASLQPPITKQSLSELDIVNIIHNPRLRHDVNFDRELHFRPNLDGQKGRMKLQNAERYWTALVAELEAYAALFHGSGLSSDRGHDPSWRRIAKLSQRRMPVLFGTIRDILRNLVPERDQARVDEHLDGSMLMQQIEYGVWDITKLSQWLAHLLKAHCAPMRDDWVDKMVEQMHSGVETSNSSLIVNGLRDLLGILEAMKLDVANHQIRHLRAPLIEETINFEQYYHSSRLKNKRITMNRSRDWYNSATGALLSTEDERPRPKTQLHTFAQALLHHLISNDPCEKDLSFPESLFLDQERLRGIQNELHELIHFEICVAVFGYLLSELGQPSTTLQDSRNRLKAAICAILGDFPSAVSLDSMFDGNLENVAAEIVRQALELSGSTATYDADLTARTTHCLIQAFRPGNILYAKQASVVERAVLLKVENILDRHANKSPLDLFNGLVLGTSFKTSTPPVPSAGLASARTSSSFPPSAKPATPTDYLNPTAPLAIDPVADAARRLTHICIVHWQIWGQRYSQEEYCDEAIADVFDARIDVDHDMQASPPSSTVQQDQHMSENHDIHHGSDTSLRTRSAAKHNADVAVLSPSAPIGYSSATSPAPTTHSSPSSSSSSSSSSTSSPNSSPSSAAVACGGGSTSNSKGANAATGGGDSPSLTMSEVLHDSED